MKTPKNILVVVGSAIVVLLLLGAFAMLLVGVGRLAISENKRKELKEEWRRFYQRDPFPSRENVLKEKESNKTIDLWFGELMRELCKHQIEPEKKSPSMFKGLLDERRNKMLDLADGKGISVPARFSFGFGRYLASGNLPAPENVPILTQQLLITEELFRLLLDSNVKEIISIERDEFDAAGAESGESGRPRGRRAAGGEAVASEAAPSVPGGRPGEFGGDALYGKLHFVFEFRARESAVWEVLSRLAGYGMIVVVTSVHLDSEGLDIVKAVPAPLERSAVAAGEEWITKAPAGKELQPKKETAGNASAVGDEKVKEKEKIPSRQERLVCGASKAVPMKVRVELDVYRFRGE